MDYQINPFVKSATFTELTSDVLWAQNRIANRYKPLIGNPLMAEITNTNTIEVILMDSGIQRDHQEFAAANIEDLYFIPNLKDTNDETGHGTAMASLIVGSTLGADPSATLKIVKIFGATYKTSEAEILAAFDAIIAYHANSPTVTRILNMSWAIPTLDSVKTKLQILSDAGVLLVGAAGNYPQNIDDSIPAGFASNFTVAGVTKLDEEYTQVYGVSKKLDVYAPAEAVCVAAFESNTGYATTDGSSPATAIVSGVLSLVAKSFINVPTVEQIKTAASQDATVGALLVNPNVSFSENRLVHRPDASAVPANQDYYAGNITVGSNESITISLNTFMPIDQYEAVFDKLSFSVEVSSTYASTVSVSDSGVVTINDMPGFEFAAGEVVNKVSLKVVASNPSIVMTSPMIHYFLSSINSTNQDIAALTDQLNAQSYLIPLTLNQLYNFK